VEQSLAAPGSECYLITAAGVAVSLGIIAATFRPLRSTLIMRFPRARRAAALPGPASPPRWAGPRNVR
jgi:hypothetical protein